MRLITKKLWAYEYNRQGFLGGDVAGGNGGGGKMMKEEAIGERWTRPAASLARDPATGDLGTPLSNQNVAPT